MFGNVALAPRNKVERQSREAKCLPFSLLPGNLPIMSYTGHAAHLNACGTVINSNDALMIIVGLFWHHDCLVRLQSYEIGLRRIDS